MYNNEVTYNDAHYTPENKSAWHKLENKFFDRSECCPSCPVAWAPEVLELLEYLDKEFGIERNTTTLRGYYMQGKWYSYLFGVNSIKSALSSFNFYFIKKHREDSTYREVHKNLSFLHKIKRISEAFAHPYQYGYKLFLGQVINPILNKFNKPKIKLGQIKEKFGSFRLYFSCPEYLTKHIDEMIVRAEIKLSLKGVYLPIEDYYYFHSEYYVNTEYQPNELVTKKIKLSDGNISTQVKDYSYRKALKDLGVDLQKLKVMADEKIKKAKKRISTRTKKQRVS